MNPISRRNEVPHVIPASEAKRKRVTSPSPSALAILSDPPLQIKKQMKGKVKTTTPHIAPLKQQHSRTSAFTPIIYPDTASKLDRVERLKSLAKFYQILNHPLKALDFLNQAHRISPKDQIIIKKINKGI